MRHVRTVSLRNVATKGFLANRIQGLQISNYIKLVSNKLSNLTIPLQRLSTDKQDSENNTKSSQDELYDSDIHAHP